MRRLGAGEEPSQRNREMSTHEFTVSHAVQHKLSSPLTKISLLLIQIICLFGISEFRILLLTVCGWEEACLGHPVESALQSTVLEVEIHPSTSPDLAALAAVGLSPLHASVSTVWSVSRALCIWNSSQWNPIAPDRIHLSPVLALYFHGSFIALWVV